jgi:signal transduction histidine kinase
VPLSRLPLRIRLVAGFVAAMILVLVAAGAFVFWRVQYALDDRLNQDLRVQTSDLRQAASRQTPAVALASLRDQARDAQLLTADGAILVSGPGLAGGRPLLTSEQTRHAAQGELRSERGHLFSPPGRHLRILAVPIRGRAPAAVAVSAVRLDQRDEALRELLAQLTIANLLALALASFVGYRLARAALDPVERYRAQAAEIAQGASGVRLDVSDRRSDELSRLGLTLNAMLDAQERAAERQQQFIDDASHELRTPLSTLSAEIDVALRKPRTAEQYEATLRRLAGSTTQLVELTETLLTLGALGSTAPNSRDIDASELLDASARRARSQLGTQSARTVDIHIPRGVSIHGDARLLGRALGNLVDNAVRYGGGTITLRAARPDGPPASAAILTVHDDGAGISPQFLGHAAERFRQGESSRAAGGAGLGLALVDAIMTAHGGQLRVCSNGHHHHQPAGHPELAAIPCRHSEVGTTVSLLLLAFAAYDGRVS